MQRLTLAATLGLCLVLSGCDKFTPLSDDVQNLTFQTLTGDKLHLSKVTGPVLVNFWATDCAICIREMPELAELYEDYRTAGFELIAVAMPYDPPNKVLEMAEQQDWPFPVALDISGQVLSTFASVKGTPTSYLLNKDGQLVKRYVGAIPVTELRSQLDSLFGLS